MADSGATGAYMYQFERDYDHLFQQKMSRVKQYARVQGVEAGTKAAFGVLDQGAGAQDITGEPLGETNFVQDPYFRRWAVRRDKESARALGRGDDLSILVNLQMGYAENIMYEHARNIDKALIDAATGVAVSGVDGTSTSAYDTTAPASDGTGGNQIALGTGTAAKMTLDKLREARSIFDTREVGTDELTEGTAQFALFVNGKGHKDLMEATEATSTDYIGVTIVQGKEVPMRMPLVGGRIPMLLGFHIVIFNDLNVLGSDPIAVAWHYKAMGLHVWGQDREMWVGTLPTRHLARGIIVQEHYGAVRIHDKGVLSIVYSAT